MSIFVNISGYTYPYSATVGFQTGGDGGTNNGGFSCYSGRVTLGPLANSDIFTASQISAAAFVVSIISTDEASFHNSVFVKRQTTTVSTANGLYTSSLFNLLSATSANVFSVSSGTDHIVRIRNTDTVNTRTFNWWVSPLIRTAT